MTSFCNMIKILQNLLYGLQGMNTIQNYCILKVNKIGYKKILRGNFH